MTRRELTVIGTGEWDRPTGTADWAVVLQDLRNGDVRIVFSEDEWETIKRQGLPPVGVTWGEPLPEVDEITDSQREMDSEWADYRAGQAVFDAIDRSTVEIVGYLEFDLGQNLAEEQGFTPFTGEEAAVIGEAVRRGTPEAVRHQLKIEEPEPLLDALIEWLRAQRVGDADSAELKAILAGKIDIDISTTNPQLTRHDS
jgi:hypothetical protein